MLRFFLIFFCVIFGQIPGAFAQIQVIAAENFYGAIAQELGGDSVNVMSILNNPEQDPHLFSASPLIAKAVANADIVIYNGADYDDWMKRLLSIQSEKKRVVLIVADLAGVKAGQNPHIWYNPAVMSQYAKALVQYFSSVDPTHKNDYLKRWQQFEEKQKILQNTVQQLKQKIAQVPVTATEPVFNAMIDVLGLKMRNLTFQWQVENESSPSPSSVKAMVDDLNNRRVRVLFYNTQVSSPLVEQIKKLARKNHIPTIAITEMQPINVDYHQWVQAQLKSLADVLIP